MQPSEINNLVARDGFIAEIKESSLIRGDKAEILYATVDYTSMTDNQKETWHWEIQLVPAIVVLYKKQIQI